MDKRLRVKAAGVDYAMSFISTNLGEAALKNILASFDSNEISSRKLLPSEWVSETAYHDLFVATG